MPVEQVPLGEAVDPVGVLVGQPGVAGWLFAEPAAGAGDGDAQRSFLNLPVGPQGVFELAPVGTARAALGEVDDEFGVESAALLGYATGRLHRDGPENGDARPRRVLVPPCPHVGVKVRVVARPTRSLPHGYLGRRRRERAWGRPE